jgi:hypothetical protein
MTKDATMKSLTWLCLGAIGVLVNACSTGSGGNGNGNDGGVGTGSGGGSGSSSSGGDTGSSSGSAGGSGSSSGSSGGGGSSSSGSSSGGGSSSSSGSSSGGSSGSSSGSSSSGGDAGSSFGSYPSGPYGTTTGAIIANMTWIGYADDAADAIATTKPYASYSLDDARTSGNHYAMINLGESDCPGCQKSAGELETGAQAVVQAGGVVIEVLETTGFVAQPAKADLDAWVNKYSLVNTTVKDPDGTGTPTLNTLGPREHAYIIDLTTMKIVDIITGDDTGIGNTSGGLAMTEMHTLLGK